MAYTVMEKPDSHTPPYALRDFGHRQDALEHIQQWEKERGNAPYPQYSIVVVRMEKEYPL